MKESQLNISPVEECILIVVNRYELYGLEIIEALEKGSGGKLKVGFGTLYPALRRLETKGFVETHWGDETADEREDTRRKYYRISPKGTSVLQEIQQIREGLARWQPACPSPPYSASRSLRVGKERDSLSLHSSER